MTDLGGAWVSVQPNLDEFRAELTSKLSAAMAGQSADVRVDADTSRAEEKIAGINAVLADWGHRTVGATADLDTGRAQAALDGINAKLDRWGTRRESATADVDTDNADRGISTLIGALLTLGPIAAAAGATAAAGLAIIPGVIAGLTTGAGALVLGFHGVGAALKAMGEDSVQTGQQAAQAGLQQLAAAQAERQAADQVANARVSLASAEQTAAQARVTAANQVATALAGVHTAEEGLAAAEYAEQQAQQALIDARAAAQRQLEDYQTQLADGALAQRQALLSVESAKQQLDATLANPQATELQRAQAQLTYDQAVQHQKDLALQYQRTQDDAAKAAQAGVDGNTQVVAAEHQVQQTKQATADQETRLAAARQAVVTAQEQGAQAVAKAEQAVAQAQGQVAAALANQAEVQQRLALQQEATTAGVTKYQKALAGLTPAGQEFVQFIHERLLPVFDSIQKADQAVLLPGLQSAMTTFLPVLATMAPYITQAGAGIADWVQHLAAFFASAQGLNDVNTLLAAGNQFMGKMGDATLSVVEGLSNLGAQAAPILGSVGGFVSRIADDFARWTTDGGSTKFLAYVQQVGPQVVGVLGDVARLLEHWFQAMAPLAPVELEIVDGIAHLADKLLTANPALGALVATLGGGAVLASKFAGPISTIAGVFKDMGNLTGIVGGTEKAVSGLGKLATVVGPLGRMLGILPPLLDATAVSEDAVAASADVADVSLLPVLATIGIAVAALAALGVAAYELYEHWDTVWHAVKRAFDDAWAAIKTAAAAVWDWVKTHWQLLLEIFGGPYIAVLTLVATHWQLIWSTVKQVAADIWGAIQAFFTATWSAISGAATAIWGGIRDFLVGLWHAISDTASTVWGAISTAVTTIWHALDTAVRAVWTGLRTFLEAEWHGWVAVVSAVWNTISGAITTVWDGLRSGASTLWNDITGFFTAGVNAVIDVLNFFIRVLDDVLGFFHLPTISPIAKLTAQAQQQAPHGGTGVPHGAVMATGGVVPGHGEGDTVPAWLTPGEFVMTRRAVQALGVPLLQQLNTARGYDLGGLVGGALSSLGGGIKDVVSGAAGVVRKGAAELAGAALSAGEAALGPLIGALPQFFQGPARSVENSLDAGVRALISGQQAAQAGPAQQVPTGQHLALIDQALQLAGDAVTAANEGAVNIIVSHESGWNARAINTTDINAQRGDPSRGLMQTIMTTFEAYRLPTLPDDIYDPLANLVAGIRYADSRYGGPGRVPGVLAVEAGRGYVGYDSGGWLRPGTNTVVNNTGRPEPVLTGDQWDRLLGQVGRGWAGTVRVYIGDRELTDLVRTEVDAETGGLVTMLHAGAVR